MKNHLENFLNFKNGFLHCCISPNMWKKTPLGRVKTRRDRQIFLFLFVLILHLPPRTPPSTASARSQWALRDLNCECKMSDRMSEEMLDRMPDRISDYMPDRM